MMSLVLIYIHRCMWIKFFVGVEGEGEYERAIMVYLSSCDMKRCDSLLMKVYFCKLNFIMFLMMQQ